MLAGYAGLLPAAVGVLLALLFGYGLAQAAFLGATLMSASILLTFAMADHHDLGEELERRAKALSVTLDLASAFAVFTLLKLVDPHGRFPLPILLGLVVVSVAALRMYVPELSEFAFSRMERTPSRGQERHVRFTLALMMLVIFAFSALDVPAFLAAFLVGFALAPVGAVPALKEKLHLVGNALFIPVFLFAVGLDTDLGVLLRWEWGNLLVNLLVIGAIAARLVGSYAGGRRLGNVVGSNIANIGLILGTCGVLSPIAVSELSVVYTLPIVLFFSLGLLYLVRSGWKITRGQGGLAVGAYVLFLALAFVQGWS